MEDYTLLFPVGAFLLIESTALYFISTKKVEDVEKNWSNIKDVYMIKVFGYILDFISSMDVEDSLIEVINVKSKEASKAIEERITSSSNSIKDLAKKIDMIEKVQSYISKISSTNKEMKYTIFASMIVMGLSFVGSSLGNIFLGITIGLELVVMYYTIYALISYRDLKKQINRVKNDIKD
ncbi:MULTISPECIES: hypothetical protein [Acidianus]|uniref:Uncharacterized protein n=1 Tax=Candidatus Acidianus copahuensis TaxID=1160895 RepID=A0A031LIA2_9CREN|nr:MULTISPECIES: hypothetical protein [Acidianus]EZQ01842.1 hypothetical protein CM19_12100 [Candidatus Acidianus copahuensis]NON63536.1 hypothetical protein [Acidianus sp. RZ1]